jgi:hypothetical protein
MSKTTATAIPPASGRGTVTRLTDARRPSSTRTASEVTRARDARRQLRSRQERFAHLKRMYD